MIEIAADMDLLRTGSGSELLGFFDIGMLISGRDGKMCRPERFPLPQWPSRQGN